MAKSTFTHAKITGLSAVAPKNEIRLEDELQFFGGNLKRMQRTSALSGMECRRVAEEGVTPSDLCAQAAENLLADMSRDNGLERASIDALIYASPHQDYSAPATACILQQRLGLSTGCAAFDVSQGCSGYAYALWLAFSLVEARATKRVLVLAGYGMTRDLDIDNRIMAPLFGDGGSATLVEFSEEATASWFSLGTDGSGAEHLMIPAGSCRLPLPDTPEAYAPYCERLMDENGVPWRLNRPWMDGGAVFDFTRATVPPLITDLLAYAGKKTDDVDYLVPHQANKQIMNSIAEASGFALDKTVTRPFSKYGNQSIASIPTAMCDALAEELNSRPLTLLLAGFGIGLSWGAALLSTDKIRCLTVSDYVKEAGHSTPESLTAFWRKKITGE